ncbi:monooxygenase, FAD-binding (plasmid) [Rhizorhabdus wittichii RW1]|uniref:Monooxygenase, FAD-binding n=1 Tax=Rhizorhabdus wittichii (strain DSM 6014 / CCUG 31198 / JCM 15750 / NBRC 105917 / EY 4224 / RW1) TaxID=392499 RepID=A0A9J9HHE6_RHIWR|nr:monooxygenase, FAD-binding [Rhizorhabdus wittichii RW1]
MLPCSEKKVFIVGGGPCGLMLSIDLSRRGIPSILLDAKPRTAKNPQANATQARTMEHYRRLGFSKEIRSLGLPKDYPTDIAYFTRYSKQELARFQLPSSGDADAAIRKIGGSWTGAELPHRVPQMYVEEVLRRHAEASELASVNYGWRMIDFEQGADGVSATVEEAATGKQQKIRAEYLVGADGARSIVRSALGISYAGETGVHRDFFGGTMVALYLRAPDFYDQVKASRAWMYWAFNRERRSWLAAVNGKDEFSFHTQLKPGEDATIDEARAHELFQQVMGMALDIEIIDMGTWVAGHALYVEQMVSGRVILAGDAAHLFTPAGGLGYNTAVEDAVNLGWKLAAILKGQAGPELLASYEFERSKLAKRNTGYARGLADSIGNFIPSPALEEDSPEGVAARKEASDYLNTHARKEFNIPGVTFGGRYDGSAVIVPDGSDAPPDTRNEYIQSATPGGRPPHIWLDDGRSLYDTFGFEWTLLRLVPGAGAGADLIAAAEARGLDLKVVDVPTSEARALYESDCVIIRPDQIVGWRHREPYDANAVFDQLLGHVASTSQVATEAGAL